tara:strand:- start:443 stop:583 length:141 start_codon:yes stop_codon:yes gene_type:complete
MTKSPMTSSMGHDVIGTDRAQQLLNQGSHRLLSILAHQHIVHDRFC